MRSNNPPIIIGLDFGTTHSGVAWAPLGSYVSVLSGWPARSGSSKDKLKAPSALVYRSASRPPHWGFDIPANESALKWFKLLLLEEKDLSPEIKRSEHLRNAKLMLQQSNRHVVEVIGDYLRELWKHALEDIEKNIGKRQVAASAFELVVTLPAIWPLYARMRMREAVQLSGIMEDRQGKKTKMSFISEPEAAALASIRDFSGRAMFKKGDHFVVCDAGGGTVDIITYKSYKRTRQRSARLSKEMIGGLCGAVRLDEGFFRLLKSRLPRKMWDQLGVVGIKTIMEENWGNGIKINVHDTSVTLRVDLPYGGTKEAHYHPPRLDFSRKDIMDIYKPVMAEVSELVFKQIREVIQTNKKPPQFLIMVGGFGKSETLRKFLETSLEDAGFDTDILQASSDRPWTAVCRGAVYRGFARCDPGPFATVDARDEKEHDVRDKAWCEVQREFLAVDQAMWFIQIGESLGTEAPISHSFWQDFQEPQDYIETELVYCNAENPPSRCDDSVKRLCVIRWSRVPNFDTLPKWKNKKGQEFRQVCYELRMVPDGDSLDFEIFYEGTMVASKNVQVDCSDSGSVVAVPTREERPADF
ncbi:hypothetical protein HIM_04055 [Hirsutella minnesotensis 3608]|uniref:Uncharacterized protein n=1 Tax=Hirsutella minnesotensis 3608 TaxID=1043627 RepID=A0A0F8A6A1_9HYPO|nr:hypothetical protein HIM_04055 [Hirsutella minnesotensis 3608]